ncbi:hypothetical protein U9M48_017128 [Paspalum notatum var. saurae]|uniref:Uncharacterized protein n=1 Tax=Paspalum notatum var. saurae TaxID=547442 RepID=A0AAQ3TAA9_PASNO
MVPLSPSTLTLSFLTAPTRAARPCNELTFRHGHQRTATNASTKFPPLSLVLARFKPAPEPPHCPPPRRHLSASLLPPRSPAAARAPHRCDRRPPLSVDEYPPPLCRQRDLRREPARDEDEDAARGEAWGGAGEARGGTGREGDRGLTFDWAEDSKFSNGLYIVKFKNMLNCALYVHQPSYWPTVSNATSRW